MIQNTNNFTICMRNDNTEILLPNLTFVELHIKVEALRNRDVSSTWQILQPNIGLRGLEMTVNGYCSAVSITKALRIAAMDGKIFKYRCIFDTGENIEGDFMITDYKMLTNSDNLQFFNMSLESSGEVKYEYK